MSFKSNAGEMGCLTIWWVWAMGLVLLVVLAGWALRPLYLQLETAQNRSSQQYIETTEARLNKLTTDYKNLDAEMKSHPDNADLNGAQRGQQRAIVNEMCTERGKIPEQYIPAGARAVMGGSC